MIIYGCAARTLLYFYNIKDTGIRKVANVMHGNVQMVEQVDSSHFFIATERGIRFTELKIMH